MFRMQVKSHFDSAHYIKDYPGKCKNLHGHRWEVEVVIEGPALDTMNILVDFANVKKLMNYRIDLLDHFILNDVLEEDNLTAEYLAQWFFNTMSKDLFNAYGGPPPKVARVCIWESPECCVKYSDNMESIGG